MTSWQPPNASVDLRAWWVGDDVDSQPITTGWAGRQGSPTLTLQDGAPTRSITLPALTKAVVFDGVADYLSATVVVAQPWTLGVVISQTTASVGTESPVGWTSSSTTEYLQRRSGVWRARSATTPIDVTETTDTGFHVWVAVGNGASSTFRVDDLSNTGTLSSDLAGIVLGTGEADGSGGRVGCAVAELFVAKGDLTDDLDDIVAYLSRHFVAPSFTAAPVGPNSRIPPVDLAAQVTPAGVEPWGARRWSAPILPVQKAKISGVLNEPSTAEVVVPKDRARFGDAGQIPYAEVQPGSHQVTLWAAGHRVWQGLIWEIGSSTDTLTLQFECEDLASTLHRRRLAADFDGNLVDAFTWNILVDMWQIPIVDDGGSVAVFPNLTSVLGLHKEPGLWRTTEGEKGADTAGETSADVFRPRWYDFENRMFDELIEELAAHNNGFEWTVRFQAVWPSNFGTFYVGYRASQTSLLGVGRDRSALVAVDDGAQPVSLEFGRGTFENVEKAELPWTARELAHYVKVGGFGERSLQLVGLNSPGVFPDYTRDQFGDIPRYRLDVVLEDQNLRSQTAVDNMAEFLAEQYTNPLGEFTMTFRPASWGTTFHHIDLSQGDLVRFRVKDEVLDVSGTARVIELAREWEGPADETVVLTLVPVRETTGTVFRVGAGIVGTDLVG